MNIGTILNLQIDDQVVAQRLTGRRSCPKCGAVYHIINLKPKVDEICDNDGARLIQRTDDSPDVVTNRLKTYYRQTKPVLDYYKNNRDTREIYDIDANKDADEVSTLIFELLDVLARTRND
jgi:adenylate kinase